LAPLSIIVYEDIITNYGQAFKHLAGRELNSEANLRLATFSGYLKKVSIMFESFKAISKGFAAAKKKGPLKLYTISQSFNDGIRKVMFNGIHSRKRRIHSFQK